MGIAKFISYAVMWMAVMWSWKVAKQGKSIPAIILGIVAWCALFLPQMLIWPNPEQKNIEWWWLAIGVFGLIGVPLAILIEGKKRGNHRNGSV
jgi:hypothetical protein